MFEIDKNNYCKDREVQNNMIRVCFLYFNARNLFNLGYLPYSFYRNIIRYIIGTTNPKLIRFVFSRLLSGGVIEKNKIGKSVLYLFNPFKKVYKYTPSLVF